MKEVVGYQNYAVDEYGNVYSKHIKGSRGKLSQNYKKLKPTKLSTGYLRVALYDSKGKSKAFNVHRLIAQAYLVNKNNLPMINHIDGCKTNNELSNLEYCTNSSNQLHAYALGLNTSDHIIRGVSQYDKNGVYVASYRSITEAGKLTGIQHKNIHKVCNYERYSAGSFIWRYSTLP